MTDSQDTSSARRHRPRVLLADDESVLRDVLAEALASGGFEVDVVSSGLAVLERLHAGEEYDVVLMDHDVPRLKGRDAVKQLRRDGFFVPVVMIGGGLTLSKRDLEGLEVSVQLRKPATVEEVTAALRAVLSPSLDVAASAGTPEGRRRSPVTWQAVTDGLDERTDRIPLGRGWLYRTTVYVNRPRGGQVATIGLATALVYVPSEAASGRPVRSKGRKVGIAARRPPREKRTS